MPESVQKYKDQLDGRSMLVKKLKILPVEAIVRGYITGSAWKEYKKSGTICNIKLPDGLQECQQLERPLFTPSTKAELGGHGRSFLLSGFILNSSVDENIHPDECLWTLIVLIYSFL